MDYEKYEQALKRAKALLEDMDKKEYFASKADIENIFPELKESEDERIKKAIIRILKGEIGYTSKEDIDKYVTWLEKQGDKSVNIDVESMVSSYEQRLKSQGGIENSPLVNMCLTAFRHGIENVLEELNLKKFEKQGEQKPNPYSGTSFEYNGHIWGMCARDNGVDILLDKQLFKHLEKQSEKKSETWCAEDEQNLNVVLSFIPDECLRRWLKDKLCYDIEDILPYEVSRQVYQIAWDCGKTFEQAFALLVATQKAYQRGKEDAEKELKKIEPKTLDADI